MPEEQQDTDSFGQQEKTKLRKEHRTKTHEDGSGISRLEQELLGDKRRLEAEVVRLKAENSRLRSETASSTASQNKLASMERENKELRGKLEDLQQRNADLSKLVRRSPDDEMERGVAYKMDPSTWRRRSKETWEDAGVSHARRSPGLAELPAITSVPRHGIHPPLPAVRDAHAITSGNFMSNMSNLLAAGGTRSSLPSISPGSEDTTSPALPAVGSWLPAVPNSNARPVTSGAPPAIKAVRSLAIAPVKETEDLSQVLQGQGSCRGRSGAGRSRRRSRGRASSRPSRPCSPSIAADRHQPGLPAPQPPSPRRMVPPGRAVRPPSRVD